MRLIGLLMVAGVIGFSNGIEAQEWEVHEGHAVKGNGTNEKLIFNDTDAQDLDEFVDLCREVCTSGEGDGPRGACGGFVVNYTDRSKTAPRLCVFKLAGSQPYKRQGKDTHILVDAEAGSESEEVGGDETSRVEIQALIDNAVAEALEGMVPKIEMEEAIDAAVGEATAQLQADLHAEQEAIDNACTRYERFPESMSAVERCDEYIRRANEKYDDYNGLNMAIEMGELPEQRALEDFKKRYYSEKQEVAGLCNGIAYEADELWYSLNEQGAEAQARKAAEVRELGDKCNEKLRD